MKVKALILSAGALASASMMDKLCNFLLIPLLTAALVPDDYGNMLTAFAYAEIFYFIALFGLHSVLLQWRSSWSYSWSFKIHEKLLIQLAVFSCLIGVVLLLLGNKFIPFERYLGFSFSLFFITILSRLVTIPLMLKTAAWTVDQEAYKVSLYSFTRLTAMLVSAYCFLDFFPDPRFRAVSELVFHIPLVVAILFWMFFYAPSLREAPQNELSMLLKESLIFGWGVQVSQVFFILIATNDRVAVNFFLGGAETAFYSVVTWALTPTLLIGSFSAPFAVRYNRRLIEGESIGEINRLLAKVLAGGAILFFAYKALLYCFAEVVIVKWTNSDYLRYANLMHYTGEILFFYLAYLLFVLFFFYEKRVGVVLKVSAGAALVSLAGCWLLVPSSGVHGALSAVASGYFLLSFLFWILLARNQGWGAMKALSGVYIGFCALFLFVDFFC